MLLYLAIELLSATYSARLTLRNLGQKDSGLNVLEQLTKEIFRSKTKNPYGNDTLYGYKPRWFHIR